MGDVIDIRELIVRRRAKELTTEFARTEEDLIRQDVLLVLSCDPYASARDIAESLWEEFNPCGDSQVKKVLRELKEEGLAVRDGNKWILSQAAQEEVDKIFKPGGTGVNGSD